MNLVIDCSVAVKWFTDEEHTDRARRLLAGPDRMWAPTLLWTELGNVLWRKFRQGILERDEALDMLTAFEATPITFRSDHDLVVSAFEMATKLGHPIYDCLYLALTVQVAGKLVTADRRLVDAVGPGHGSVVHIADF